MEARVLFVFVIAIFLSGVHSATFTVKNHCPYTIYPTFLTGTGSQSPTTGFDLASHASKKVKLKAPWSGRIWARFLCSNSSGRFTCLSGDCGTGQIRCDNQGAVPPVTLVEFNLAGNGGQDFYDISLVDGFNLPVKVQPEGGGSCRATECRVDVNARCPDELAIRSPNDGKVIGCKSGCLALNEPRYCCTGEYGSPQTCSPSEYSQFFKGKCPDAYSYAYDDASSLLSCPTGANYLFTFCP